MIKAGHGTNEDGQKRFTMGSILRSVTRAKMKIVWWISTERIFQIVENLAHERRHVV